ncbi:MAG TPA: hypothetical protein VMU24_12005 [Candidatus Acidoferrales bacterium]|nr:hypothetical protein [Candidatus Acidoferrales bacterium]
MSLQEVSVEQLAKVFHHYHEALAPDFKCNKESGVESWQELSSNERSRLIAAMRLTLLEITSAEQPPNNDRRRYFAKPGEAEWGA